MMGSLWMLLAIKHLKKEISITRMLLVVVVSTPNTKNSNINYWSRLITWLLNIATHEFVPPNVN
jgi:hypothetical protein